MSDDLRDRFGFIPPRTSCPSSSVAITAKITMPLAVVFTVQSALVVALMLVGLPWVQTLSIPVLLLITTVAVASTRGNILRSILVQYAHSSQWKSA